MAIAAVAVYVMLSLVGCGSTSPRSAQEAALLAIAVPAAWSAADVAADAKEGASSLAQWWLRFDDPLLGRLIDQALQANTRVTSAQAALRQARALRDAAAATLVPIVGSSASAQRSTTGNDDASNRFQAGFDASWELDFFGVNRSALRSSEAAARASAASLGEVQVSISAEVALNYITLRGTQSRLAIATANLATQQETLQITQWRQQAGLVTVLEAEQARAAAAQTSAQLPALRTSIAQTSHALAVLTGQPPNALAPILTQAGPVPQALDDLVLRIPAETLRQRPDVRAAQYQVTAAVARVAQADAARLPNFKLSGSLGLSALTLGTLTNGASLVSTLLAVVAMPLFDGGARSAQVRAQQGALDQAQSTYRAAVLTALREVEDALVALGGDRERLARLREAADAAGSAAQLARYRYGSGLVDFQIVLETQRTALSTQDAVASATSDLGADHVRLYKSLGGGWLSTDDTEIAMRKSSP